LGFPKKAVPKKAVPEKTVPKKAVPKKAVLRAPAFIQTKFALYKICRGTFFIFTLIRPSRDGKFLKKVKEQPRKWIWQK
jgi:hypothetical protein